MKKILILAVLAVVIFSAVSAYAMLEEKQIWNAVYDSTTQTIKVGS